MSFLQAIVGDIVDIVDDEDLADEEETDEYYYEEAHVELEHVEGLDQLRKGLDDQTEEKWVPPKKRGNIFLYIKNFLFLFVLQLRLRESYFILYVLFVSSNPVSLLMTAFATVTIFLEALFFTVIFSVAYSKDMHSSIRIVIKWELARESRLFKYFVYFCLSVVMVISLGFFVFMSLDQPSLQRTGLFKHLWGSVDCQDGTEGEQYNPDGVSRPDSANIYDWSVFIWSFMSSTYLDIFKGIISGLLVYFRIYRSNLNYDGPSSERYCSSLSYIDKETGFRKNREIPEPNISFWTCLTTNSNLILRDFFLILFYVDCEMEVKKFSELPSYSHYNWDLLEGLSTIEIHELREFFYDFSSEEFGQYDSCLYQNEKCFPITTCCMYCCLLVRCLIICTYRSATDDDRPRSSVRDAIEDAKTLQKGRIERMKKVKSNRLKRLRMKENCFLLSEELSKKIQEVKKARTFLETKAEYVKERIVKLEYGKVPSEYDSEVLNGIPGKKRKWHYRMKCRDREGLENELILITNKMKELHSTEKEIMERMKLVEKK